MNTLKAIIAVILLAIIICIFSGCVTMGDDYRPKVELGAKYYLHSKDHTIILSRRL